MATNKTEEEIVIPAAEEVKTVKPSTIKVEDLIEPADGDSEAALKLKLVYAAYYKQNPHRGDDELEKGQLLAKLKAL